MRTPRGWLDPYWKQRKYPSCWFCGKPLTQRPGRGRPRKTCSDRCRQADRRAQLRYVREEMDALVAGEHVAFTAVRFYGDWRHRAALRDKLETPTADAAALL